MRNKHPVWSGFLLLIIGGVIGYGIGLGLEQLTTGAMNFTGAVPSAFALLFAVTAFFFVPCGFTADGLPVGLQIVGARLQDALVLRAAAAFEAAVPCAARRPTL